MYIPRGKWFDYWSGQALDGGQEHTLQVKKDEIPIFIKQGAVIPKYPIQQYVGEKVVDTVTLDIYHTDEPETSFFYDDGGDGYAYESGNFNLSTFTVDGTNDGLTINQKIEGDYQSIVQSYRINFKGLPFDVNSVVVDGQAVELADEGVVVTSKFGRIEVRKS